MPPRVGNQSPKNTISLIFKKAIQYLLNISAENVDFGSPPKRVFEGNLKKQT